MVSAPLPRACSTAPMAYGVRPEAEIPTTVSSAVRPRASRSAAASSLLSSAPSTALTMAEGPPAIRPMTSDGSVLKVGGHSLASRTPRRPAVPAPA